MHHYDVVATSSPSGPVQPKTGTYLALHSNDASDANSGFAETSEKLLVAFELACYGGKRVIGAQALAIPGICEGAPNPQDGVAFAHRVKRGEQCTCRPWALEVVDILIAKGQIQLEGVQDLDQIEEYATFAAHDYQRELMSSGEPVQEKGRYRICRYKP
ncbi:hypothetical protein DL770_002563 [Monosporascus sp. CRB-9-2]|nr:hypothetical protein DL770_002563 [Monosporascus sp. CRB-9-2]